MEYEMLSHTGSYWGHGNCNLRTKKISETIPGKHSIDSLQKNSNFGNITYNKESATVWNPKPERWGTLLAPEAYQGTKTLWQVRWWWYSTVQDIIWKADSH
jgi:hypothetical protein